MEASELYKSYETDFLLAQSEIEQKLESISTLERGEYGRAKGATSTMTWYLIDKEWHEQVAFAMFSTADIWQVTYSTTRLLFGSRRQMLPSGASFTIGDKKRWLNGYSPLEFGYSVIHDCEIPDSESWSCHHQLFPAGARLNFNHSWRSSWGTQVIAFCYSSDTVRSHVYTGLNLSISSTNTDARTSAVKAVERTIGEAYEIVSIEGGYLVDTNDILVKNGSGFLDRSI